MNYSPFSYLHYTILLLLLVGFKFIFPHKTLTVQNMHIILCHCTVYCLPLPPHVSKILSNVSQEKNSRTQMAHINCFPVPSTLFIVTFNEGEHSPLLFPGRGHYIFFINTQSTDHRYRIMRLVNLVHLIFSRKAFHLKDKFQVMKGENWNEILLVLACLKLLYLEWCWFGGGGTEEKRMTEIND